MPWKMNAEGQIELNGGNPVWVQEDGSEATIQGNTVNRLNNENKALRQRAEQAEQAAAPFEGLDPVAVKDALDKVAKIDQKQLIDAGKANEVTERIKTEYEAKLKAATEQAGTLQAKLDANMRKAAFASSQFLAERVNLPPDVAEAYFQQYFKVDGDRLVAVGRDGQTIGSKNRIGEDASFDEAIEIILSDHPNRDALLKAPAAGGSGMGPAAGRAGGSQRIKRSDFEKLDAGKQREIAIGGKIEIVDG